ACGGDSPSEPTPDPLEITVTGVEDGQSYSSAVTIDISVNRGSFEARLDGDLFFSGRTVTGIGTHTLEITARDGADQASRVIDFELIFEGDSFLIVRMLDLGDNDSGGGGDAILVTDSAQGLQAHVLIDAGPAGVGGANPGFVADRLQQLGVSSLEAVILTHAHTDHFEGLPAVLTQIGVERFIYNGQVRSFSGYNTVLGLADSNADTVIVPESVLPIALTGEGGSTLQVIPPLTAYLGDTDGSSELNNGSVGARLERGAFSAFFTGDGESEANDRWRRDYGALSGAVDMLKVGHHGANDAIFDTGTSGSSSWLDHTDPSIMLISANGTTHPRENALTKIMSWSNTRTYCTNVHGDIELRVDIDGNTSVTVEKNASADCEAGSDAT
ncbi:MAG: ComEC/Rec2 family competence protein, partial [Candidatus Longimicrobiales bacterium M2_2A_002]